MARRKAVKKKTKKVVKREVVKKSKRDDKILMNILLVAAVIIIAGFLGVYLMGRGGPATFDYHGVNYTIVQFCDAKPCLTTYNTKLPVFLKGKPARYKFYFRNDPRTLEEEVPFNGKVNLKKEMNLNVTYGLACEGYSSVAMDNFGRVFRVYGTTVSDGEDMTCGADSNKMYVTIQEGAQTKVEQTGNFCYVITIKDCEILKGTERFLNSALVEMNKELGIISS